MSRLRERLHSLRPVLLVPFLLVGVPAVSVVTSVATASPAAATVPANQFAWPATGHTDAGDVAWHQAHESGAKAVDIQAPLGTVVGAAQSGVVVTSSAGCEDSNSWGCGNGFGNYVVIRHDRTGVANPLYTLYAHLAKASVITGGTQVMEGQQLGTIAVSGSSTGPHTHFAIGTCATPWYTGTNCTIWNGADTSDTTVTKGSAVPGTYSQLEGTGAGLNQYLADVTGDGKADAVVYYPGPELAGNWYVAPSTGTAFAPASLWIAGTGAGSDKRFLADVTGDGKADAIMYWGSTGTWYVAASNGASFTTATQWSTGQIAGSSSQLVADVTGDGKADALAFSLGAGTWYVSPSNASSFTGFSQWKTGYGAGSSRQFAADATGEGKADAIPYWGSPNGWFYVAPSTGTSFGAAGLWSTGQIASSTNQFLGDVTGDGKADALAYSSAGTWYASPSNGANAFTGFSQWTAGFGVGSTNQLLGDVTGDGKADALVYEGGAGNWWVRASTGTGFGAAAQWTTQFGIGS